MRSAGARPRQFVNSRGAAGGGGSGPRRRPLRGWRAAQVGFDLPAGSGPAAGLTRLAAEVAATGCRRGLRPPAVLRRGGPARVLPGEAPAPVPGRLTLSRCCSCREPGRSRFEPTDAAVPPCAQLREPIVVVVLVPLGPVGSRVPSAAVAGRPACASHARFEAPGGSAASARALALRRRSPAARAALPIPSCGRGSAAPIRRAPAAAQPAPAAAAAPSAVQSSSPRIDVLEDAAPDGR